MALSNTPFGFKPIRHLSGGTIRADQYTIASAYATTIGTGCPVKAISDGTIQLASAGDRLLGIFEGCQYIASDGSVVYSAYWPASTTVQTGTTVKAFVWTDPNIVYLVQSGGTPTLDNNFNLADHVVGTVSTVTGQSADYLNSSMGTGNAGFRVHRLSDLPGNSGQYALLEVTIFEHEFNRDDAATPGV